MTPGEARHAAVSKKQPPMNRDVYNTPIARLRNRVAVRPRIVFDISLITARPELEAIDNHSLPAQNIEDFLVTLLHTMVMHMSAAESHWSAQG